MVEPIVAQSPLSPTHICRRCGRKLKNEESKYKGMGYTCFQKWLREGERKKLFSMLLYKNKNDSYNIIDN